MDREKVINAVETAFELWIDEYTGCSWFKEDEVRQAKEDACALLKEHEAVEPTWQQGKAYCGSCGKRIPLKIGARFCHKCGQAVKWK